MDHSATFARQFARLVWLLIQEPLNVEEQKGALRALATISRDGAVMLAGNESELTANAAPVPHVFSGVPELVSQMAAHGLATISVDASAAAGDLLGVARLLAGAASADDGGANAEAKRVALGASTVRFSVRPRPSQERPALPAMEFGDVLDEVDVPVRQPTPRSTAIIAASGDSSGHRGGMFDQFAAARAPIGSHDQHLERLEASNDPTVLTHLLDDLVVFAENAARDGKASIVSDILYRIVRREGAVDDADAKRVFVMAFRRLARPVLLRAVATQLPVREERREEYVTVLARAGEDGAEAVIEQIAAVARKSERRIYFDVLLQLQSGISALLHMLGDHRWFVSCNAADLLGEMQAREAEQPLTELLRHEDDRVRRSATGALMRLGTPRAMQAIQDALRDPSPQVRIEASAALLTRKDVRTAAVLLRALDVEKDNEVQAAFLVALGKLATPDAVQRLLRTAEAERGLFKKKTTALRVAAVNGLGEARTGDATDALRALLSDKDPDVRDAATYSLGRIVRNSMSVEQPEE